MDVLVLGGSVFLGRAVVAQAQEAGASVTVFNRGVSGPDPVGVTALRGDRTVAADLEQLSRRRFDLVVDTSGYVPADVAASARVLAPTCARYAFVSTINVYPGWPERLGYWRAGVHDGDPDARRTDAPDEDTAYGWLKAGCELAVRREFGPDRTIVLRAGCVVGPDDSVIGRLPWWLARVARGGEVLVPGGPDDVVALIDARDLARFATQGTPGTFDLAGADHSRGELMSACRDVTASVATFTYVDSSWLAGQGVEPWTEVPLWVPDAPGLFAHDPAAASIAGLRCRPLGRTVADTWGWQSAVPGGWRSTDRTPGLAAEREAEVLRAWRA